jgi:uncharacterized membrane protein YqjE
MSAQAEIDQKPEQTATQNESLDDSGVLADVKSLWCELRGLSVDRLRLAALETQRAGDSLVAMIIAGIMVAALFTIAWLGLLVAAVMALIDNGLAACSAILLAVVFNLFLALILLAVIRRKSRYLQFPATLRSLQPQVRQVAGKA